jgi:hypothetical protein
MRVTTVAGWLSIAGVLWSLTCGSGLAQDASGTSRESAPRSGEAEPAVDAASPAAARVQAHVTFEANNGGSGTWLEVTPSGGIRLHERWTLEAGLPLYYLAAGSTEEGTAHVGIGDLYLSVSFDMSSEATVLSATGTAGAPTGSAERGLGLGAISWDVSGHVGRTFGRITPSLDAGMGSNIVLAAATGPGRLADGAGGVLRHAAIWTEVEIWRSMSLSAGVYGVRPVDSAAAVPTEADSDFDETEDDASRDEGFHVVGSGRLTRYLELSLWFTRSRAFAYNTFSISLGLDLGGLARKSSLPGAVRRRSKSVPG